MQSKNYSPWLTDPTLGSSADASVTGVALLLADRDRKGRVAGGLRKLWARAEPSAGERLATTDDFTYPKGAGNIPHLCLFFKFPTFSYAWGWWPGWLPWYCRSV